MGHAGHGTATVLVHLTSELADIASQFLRAGLHGNSKCRERAVRSMLDMCACHGQQQVCCGALPQEVSTQGWEQHTGSFFMSGMRQAAQQAGLERALQVKHCGAPGGRLGSLTSEQRTVLHTVRL